MSMLGDDVLHALPGLRSAAESLMVDTATISRSGGVPTLDPNTGLTTTPPATTVHTGLCRVRQPTAMESEILFGEEQLTRSRLIVCFPHTVTGVRVDDIVTIIESDDADLLTRSFRITAVPLSTFTLYKGFPCEVIE